MDIGVILQPFMASAAALLGGPQLIAATISQIILSLLKEINFDPTKALEELEKIGFKISQALLPELIEAAKAGVKSLTQWFVTKLSSSSEVNEATTQVLMQQAEPIATAAQQAAPNETEQLADLMKEGLASFGGATAQIADQYAEVVKDLSKLTQLVEEMQKKTNAWASMSIEAKNNSLVRDVHLIQEGITGGSMKIRAEDHSTVEAVNMEQRNIKPPFPQEDPSTEN